MTMDILGLIDLPSWLLLTVAIATLLYIYGRMPYNVWTKFGIPGPKPKLFVGNMDVIRRMGMGEAFHQWKARYGRVVGVYLMRRPMLLVSDVNMLKQMLVTEFNHFSHRGFIIPKEFMDKTSQECLLFVEGEQWRRIRNLLTPAFTSGRLREKAKFINEASGKAIQTMVKAAEQKETISARDVYTRFTLDVILGSLFGMDLHDNEEVSRKLSQFAPQFIRPSNFRLKMYMLASMFPILSSLLGVLANESRGAQKFYRDFVQQAMNDRKVSQHHHKDFLQNMIDAESQDTGEQTTRKKMSFDEIVGQTSLFFLAGNDTSAMTLMFLSYLLAKHPDIQDRVYREIQTEIKDEEPNYDSVHRLKYLEACVKESLRLYPATAAFTRQSTHDVVVNGYTIPAGTGVYVPVMNICKDPDYYPHPEKFNPNRFVKGDPDEVTDWPFLGFGIGPRMCIGMRLALYQIMMAMAAILRKVKFVGASDIIVPPAVMFGIPPMNDSIMLELEMRK